MLGILLLEQIVVPGTIPAKVDFKKKSLSASHEAERPAFCFNI